MRIGKLTLTAAAYAAPFVVFLAVYLPAAGHGFISDDFGWILHNRVRSLADLWRVAHNDNGFYRPAVAFSFAANELVFGLNPRAYGLTNVALATLCGAAVYLLCRALTLPRSAAVFGSALWLLNPHGVNMGILWISGRTALMATAAAAACTAALLRGRLLVAAVLLALAVFSREDAALLPVISTIWLYVLRRHGVQSPIRASRWLLMSGAVVLAYFAIRSTTDAMTPATAPAYYQLSARADVLLPNVAEYADRTMTFALGVLLLMALVLRPAIRVLDAAPGVVVICGVIWLVGFLLPALLLPVRSSLYACLPSVGTCVAASAVASRWWLLATPARRQYALIVAVLLPLLMWPVYQARTQRWVRMAEFSRRALTDLDAAVRNLPDDSDLLIVDDRSTRANMASVFSGRLRDGYLLVSGRYMNFYVDPPIPNAGAQSGGVAGCGGCEDVRLEVKDARLVTIREP